MLSRAQAPILLAAEPAGPGWVHAVIARRTYRHRLGFADQDLALQAEGRVLALDGGWRFVGRRRPPLVDVLIEGWIPRPAGLHAPSDAGAGDPRRVEETTGCELDRESPSHHHDRHRL